MSRRPATTVIFAGFFLLGMLFILWGILLPDIAVDLAMSELISGALFTLFSLGMMIGAIVGGKYASRFDFMQLMAVLMTINCGLLGVLTVLTAWPGVLGLVFVIGAVSSAIFTIGHTLIARMYQEKRFTMMGFMDFMFSLGTLTASFYVTLVYRYADNWRLPLQCLSAVMLLVAIYAFMVAGAQRQHRRAAGHAPEPGQSLAFKDVLRQPVFLLLALAGFGYGAVEFGNANWFVSYAQNGIGYSGETARNLLACFTGGMVLSRLGFALLLRWFSVHRLVVVLASLAVSGTFIIKLSDGIWGIGGGSLLLGLGLGGLFPLMLSAAMSISPENGPVLSGISIIGNATGVQVASFTTGWWASFVPLTIAFWVIPMAGVWLWFSAWGYSRLLKRQPAAPVSAAHG
ncbi:MFS transporter [Alteromonas sp. ASW11-19]|uniref:MFS transporter n=1 Tax=Alteromonas salexigens TaxID=2982530 RepID=A0ABT2VMN3_9ALTE|nr:MFS transporter [Alteromonas salexigens]MCU7553496.1 MFS transporter [Alteromonas salexigens]